jgi:hypothetical protein
MLLIASANEAYPISHILATGFSISVISVVFLKQRTENPYFLSALYSLNLLSLALFK